MYILISICIKIKISVSMYIFILFIIIIIYLFKVDKLVKALQNYYIKTAIPTCGMLIKVNYLS